MPRAVSDTGPRPVSDSGVSSGGSAKPLAIASQLLGLAQKTVDKLLPSARLDSIVYTALGQGTDEPVLKRQLESECRARLARVLAEHEQKRRPAAESLGVSPNTLVKILRRFGIA